VLTTTFGQCAPEILFATGAREYWRRASNGHADQRAHLDRDRIESFAFRASGLLDRKRLEEVLAELPPEVYRLKGIVQFAGEDWCSIVNYTCGRARLDWHAPVREAAFDNRILVIGREVSRWRDSIVPGLEACRAPVPARAS
jgi:G3E family GTPase